MDEFDGYVRADGSAGTRNLILVVSLIDLANDVAARTADLLPGAVALLTPGGGLSFGAEAALIGRLRRRTALNPNVGAVLVVGSAGKELQRWPGEIAATGRPSEAICLSDQRDSVAAVIAGVELGQRFAATLSGQSRRRVPLSALRIGLRSSSSSLVSARLVNTAVGTVVDTVVENGGAVAFGETADLAGVSEALAERGADPPTAAALRQAMADPVRLSRELGSRAPDPTPTNAAGGIDTIEKKGQGALRRLGTGCVHAVFPYGDGMAPTGLQMMTGPGSAAVCLAGLAAAGCTLVLYTVGMTSITSAAPLTPVLKVGPPLLATSRDIDVPVAEPPGDAGLRLLALVLETASGRASAGETLQGRHLMLPGYLPPL